MKTKIFALILTVAVLMTIAGPLRGAALTDDQIVASVRNTYVFKTSLQGDDVKVVSKNGVVTLTGVVASPAHKALAKETALALPGVKSVNNNLTIKGAEPTRNSDRSVKDNVKSTLALHRSVKDSQIDVSVHNGVVTLEGVAKNKAKKELATAYAEDVEGVVKVENKMTIAGAPNSNSSTSNTKDYIDDASITAQVMYALATHRSTSILKTKVATKDGVVTLSGTAKNQAERTLATLLANDIDGVDSVINLMSVK